jgi:hypothetical protein
VSTDQEWADLCGSLPEHSAEVMAAHQGAPSVAVQSVTHGAGMPAEDRGQSDTAKYA